MGPECNRLHQINYSVHQNKNTVFLPMLCSRPSIKDVHGLQRSHERPSSSSSSSSSTDPLSPKISCIGQVKRKNKVVVFPNPHKLTAGTTTSTKHAAKKTHSRNNSHDIIISGVKYSKLKKFFSSKNLTAAAGERGHVAGHCGGGGCRNGRCEGLVSIVDLDPPLPVVKRPISQAQQEEAAVESLWKRRSGGATLKGLQLQRLHHPRHHLQPTTV